MVAMNDDKRDLPIGVFDSGLGGLTVVRELRRQLPSETILYLGDSARVPYGTRSAATVIRYAEKCSSFLMNQGLKMLAVACNTASAVALPSLRRAAEVPVLGVIAAGARAVTATGAHRVGVIGTQGTIRSQAYRRRIGELAPDCQVIEQPAPLFVPLAEEGWTEGEVPELVASRYLSPLVQEKIEVLLLGCTHYPLLLSSIRKTLTRLGSAARVIDSATAMTDQVRQTLEQNNLRSTRSVPGALTCYVTDVPDTFQESAARFLGEAIADVNQVDIL